jgi:hypothetical protein
MRWCNGLVVVGMVVMRRLERDDGGGLGVGETVRERKWKAATVVAGMVVVGGWWWLGWWWLVDGGSLVSQIKRREIEGMEKRD